MTRSYLSKVTSAILVLGAFAAGCGDDDGDDGNMDGGQPMLDGTVPTSDGSAPGQMTQYTGTVVNSTNTLEFVSGREVRLFDINTLAFVGNPQTSAGAMAEVTFADRPGNVGLFVKGGNGYQDTLNFPPSRLGEEKLIRLGTEQSATLVPGAAGYTAQQNASALAGAVYWRNTATNKDELVGCATIEGDGLNDVRYFTANGLPTSLANRSLAQGTKPPMGDRAQPSNNGEAGRFFAANALGGPRTVIVKIGGVEVARKNFTIKPRSEGTPIAGGPSTLHIGGIWIEGKAENPTPAGCM